MKIQSYKYIHGTINEEDRIGLLQDRKNYMTDQYIKIFKEYLSNIKLEGNTALLYAVGISKPQGEDREIPLDFEFSISRGETRVSVKDLTAYMAHKYMKILSKNNNITFMDINSNSCASSMYSIFHANILLELGIVDNVIIVAEEKTSYSTLRVFKQSNIDIKLGEGAAFIVLTKGNDISNAKWYAEYNSNPFMTTVNGYKQVFTKADIIKVHGTGTEVNNKAEQEAYKGYKILNYKNKIGHCQGASALIELLLAYEDKSIKGKVLCVASGLGGFYGSCILNKD